MKSNQDFAQRSVVTNGKSTSFYNTIHSQGNDLVKAKKRAETQESKILDFFQVNEKLNFTKHEIKNALVNLGKMNVKTPESSVSRALSNLHKQGKILKLEEIRLGEFDKPNICGWLRSCRRISEMKGKKQAMRINPRLKNAFGWTTTTRTLKQFLTDYLNDQVFDNQLNSIKKTA